MPERHWRNRDSSGAQKQVGELWAMLRADCTFKICVDNGFKGDPCVTDAENIWLEVKVKGFDYFEEGVISEETFYLPTGARLAATVGKDWY